MEARTSRKRAPWTVEELEKLLRLLADRLKPTGEILLTHKIIAEHLGWEWEEKTMNRVSRLLNQIMEGTSNSPIIRRIKTGCKMGSGPGLPSIYQFVGEAGT